MAAMVSTMPSTTSTPTESSKLFTCIACHVAFHQAEGQRTHYRTDWHRYNLKRKVAELPPVTAEEFAQRVLARQAENKHAEEKANLMYECTVCNKTYGSENAYQNHVTSKKHKEQAQKQQKRSLSTSPTTLQTKSKASKSTDPSASIDLQGKGKEEQTQDLSTSEEQQEENVDEKILTDKDCLFCNHTSGNLEENVKHMAQSHSFFIPDIEYLVDLPGLIEYLGKKVSLLHGCLWCFSPYKGSSDGTPNPNASTKGLFKSLDDVRRHMRDKGHCKILYEDGADLEVADFYDFSETWNTANPAEDGNDDEWEDVDEDDVMEVDSDEELGQSVPSGLALSAEGTELILPSGVRLGHRTYARYYRQSLRPTSDSQRESVVINRLVSQYKMLGYHGTTVNKEDRMVDRIKDTKKLDYNMKLGMKANKLQKHYRAQVMF